MSNAAALSLPLASTALRLHARVSPVKPIAAALMLLWAGAHAGQAAALDAGALPTGGVVTGGSATLQAGASRLDVTQSTQRAAIDWTTFDIGSAAQVNFSQPSASSIVLNRVTGGSASEIAGRLTSNGQVFLSNPNGILFTRGAQVDVGGLVASSLNLSAADFMAGRNAFIGGGAGANVINQGRISAADGGYVALLGGQVSNAGVITAKLGQVAMAAGDKVTLDFAGDGLLKFTVGQAAVNAQIANSGLVQADGGSVAMTTQAAGELLSGVVNNTGIVQAQSLSGHGGVIRLSGDLVVNTGTLDVSGPTGGDIGLSGRSLLQGGDIRANGTVGNGGSVALQASGALIQTAAGHVTVDATGAAGAGGDITAMGGSALWLSGSMSASGPDGGGITVTAPELTLAAASLAADGHAGGQGGSLLIGGDAHGANPAIANASHTMVNAYSTLSAQGEQGKIVVWSDDSTSYFGSATTGAKGFVEVSGKQTLNFGGQIDAGTGGNVLLDPANLVIDASAPAQFYLDLANPNPAASEQHGTQVLALTSGNIVVSAPNDSFGGTNAGAVYLYNGTTGALISTLTGGTAADKIGGSGLIQLSNGNFIVRSQAWHSGASSNVGAVTWGSGTTGVTGIVTSANSLVGSAANDAVGSDGLKLLSNGNYLVSSSSWNGSRGAVTWGSGTSGVSGVVSSSNSLVGSTALDRVGDFSGSGITLLSNGNYVVNSYTWDNGSVVDAGAVTWGSGTAGVSGLVSSSNSLVGSTANDYVGSSGILELSNGNYLVKSPNWSNAGAASSGAITWGSGTTGVKGVLSSANSLVGSHASDNVGNITTLTNGNYVVVSSIWNNGMGAVTWGSGTAGVSGVISSSNSLVGSTITDGVGVGGVTALSNGNYVVNSYLWDSGGLTNVGAVTWGSGTSGITGTISSANSLVGSKAFDAVGVGGVIALTNGNYVVVSGLWDNGSATDAGAVTWGSGTAGVKGAVSSSNSLVGSINSDKVGGDVNGNALVTALSNGNYVVRSTAWNTSTAVQVGAVTWGNGTTGVTGAVSSSNSLVGATANDQVGNGGLTTLSNGNFVVSSYVWDNGSATNAGAATWVNGTTGLTGAISASNSLVGGTTNDLVGSSGVTALPNGNYLVRSGNWGNAGAANAGAVTWGNGSTGITGLVSSANSLVGTHTSDQVGSTGITVLNNGNYIVASSAWDNGSIQNAGAITWGSASAGISGEVSALNSLVGGSTSDQVGSVSSGNLITELGNGNFLVRTTNWHNGSAVAGALTWGNGTAGISGVLSSNNSLVGTAATDFSTASTITVLSNGNYLAINPDWDNGAIANAGAVTWGSGTSGVSGVISAANSLVGSTAQDRVGTGVATLTNGNYVVRSTQWDNGSIVDAGAVTWGSGTSGITGAVSSGNSLVGSTTSDVVGQSVTTLTNGNYVVGSFVWDNGTAVNAGAVTWGNGATGTSGAISAANSLVGTATNEQLGASGTITALSNSNYVVRNQQRNSNAGAVWLVVDPSNLVTTINNASGTASVNPAAIAGAAVAGSTVTLQATNNVTVNSAVNVAGRLNLVAGNTLTLNAGITSTAAGDALQLAGQSFVNNVGASALSTPNGRWLVWSGTPSNDTRGGLSYDFKQYNATYGSSTVLGSGNGLLYTTAPVITASLTGTASKVYDATTSATLASANYASSGALDGDTVTLSNPTSGTYADRNAGTGKNVAVTGLTLSGASNGAAAVYGYQLASGSINGNIGTITPKSLSMSGLSVPISKEYDGTTAAVVSGSAALAATEAAGTGTSSDGKAYTGDTVSITGTATGAYNSKDVATANVVTFGGLSLTGAQAGNYSLALQNPASASITTRGLAVTGISAVDKVYDTTTAATLTGTAAVTALGSDSVSVGGTGTGAFASKNVGTGKAVTVTGYTLSGADAGNYNVVQPAGLTANITAATLSVAGVSAADKVYDTNVTAALTGTAAVTALGSDSVTVGGTATGTFANKNVGTGKAVTVTGYTLGGTDAGNYTLVQPAGLTANITAANLSINGLTAAGKTYDGNTAAILSGTASVSALGSDSVTLGGSGTGAFANKNVGTGKAVTVTGYTLGGTDAANYTLVAPASLTADISARTVTARFTAADKVYDATTAATLIGSAFASGDVVGSDVLSLSYTGASFANSAVGTAKAVTVAGAALGGTDAANYRIGSFANTTASITPAALSVRANDASRAFGAANPTFSATLTGLKGSDTLASLGGTLAFNTPAVATSPAGPYAITPLGLSSSNYTVAFVDGVLTITAPPPAPATGNPGLNTAVTLANVAASIAPRGASQSNAGGVPAGSPGAPLPFGGSLTPAPRPPVTSTGTVVLMELPNGGGLRVSEGGLMLP